MDPRNSVRSEKDVPIIGDYSETHNARIRGAAPEAPAPAPRAAPAARGRARDDRLVLDPSDVRRHAQRLRQREHRGPLGKLLRYAPAVLAAAVVFGAYWNFDRLREISVSFAPLRSSSGGDAPVQDNDARRGGELQTESIAAPVVVGTDAVVAAANSPPEPEARVIDPSTDALPTTRPATDPGPPAQDDTPPSTALPAAVADLEPARVAPPPPPPEPETFVLGLPTITASEGDAAVAVIILRNGDDRAESFVNWRTSAGTATPGVDYIDLGPMIERFPPGAQNRTIRIPIVGDGLAEGPETFYVHLEPNEGASVPAERLRTEVVITDDD